jgi:squalene/oxidosqualene cyclase-like protein
VNAVLNAFVHHFRGAEGREELDKKMAANDVYLWDGHDGMKFQGYNGSELWDTAFAVQAIFASPFASDPRFEDMLSKAHAYVRDNQILEDVPSMEQHYRHASKGGWPITDCTSEGFKCALLFEPRGYEPEIPLSLLRDSVRLMLSWQNEDGGWATYELKRGGEWLEALNPSQVFGDIMVDYSYVECTSTSIDALIKAKRRFPGEFDAQIDPALRRAEAFLRRAQRPDGSFEGSWAVCFTYGTWFAMSGFQALGVGPKDGAVQRAVQFLLEKQRPDGSWGEAGDTCRERRWIEAKEGQVVQTAWAMLALMRGGCTDDAALERAARFLIGRQETDGSWAREPLVGVFNRTCLINYDNYRHYFPLWALAEWSKR